MIFPLVLAQKCLSDSDCLVYDKQTDLSASICVNSNCQVILAPGASCTADTQCSLYHYRNRTAGALVDICSAKYCTYNSLCVNDKNVDLLTFTGCCAGALEGESCAIVGKDVCQSGSSCTPADNSLVCKLNTKQSTQWIGVIITLISAVISNLGLNLQKLALRRRFEKRVKHEQIEHVRLMKRLLEIKASFSNFYKNISLSTLSFSKEKELDINIVPATLDRPLNPVFSRSIASSEKAEKSLSLYENSIFSEFKSPSVATFDKYEKTEKSDKVDVDSTNGKPLVAEQDEISAIASNSSDTKHFESPTATTSVTNRVSALTIDNNTLQETSGYSSNDLPLISVSKRTSMDPEGPASRPEFQTELGFGSLVKNPRWVLGFLVFTIGNFLNVIALQFAAQSLVAPLGSLSLVVNVILAPWLNNEVWGYKDIIGVILIIGGSSLVVAFAGSSQHDYCLSVLLALFRKVETIVFLSILAFLITAVFSYIVIVEKNIHLPEHPDGMINEALDQSKVTSVERVDEGNSSDIQVQLYENITPKKVYRRMTITAPEQSLVLEAASAANAAEQSDKDDSKSVRSVNVFTVQQETSYSSPFLRELYLWWIRFKALKDKIKLVPRFKEPIPLNSFFVRIMLPFCYASLGGLMATVTVLFAKATVNLLTLSIFQGNNQYNHFDSWVITAVTIVTAVLQIYWINLGLARYDALIQIPVFYVVWTLFDVIGGGIYYGEFDGFTPVRYVLFCLGVCVIFAGVAVLAGRLKQLNDEEQQLNKAIALPAE